MDTLITIGALSLTLFLLMDPIGNIPVFLAVLKDVPLKKQRFIILRELCIALMIIIFFCFAGEILLNILDVKPYVVMLAGGIILFLIALKMIFPEHAEANGKKDTIKDPFIVPLAIPLVAGPAVLATVMLYPHQGISLGVTTTSIVLAWMISSVILLAAPRLQKLLGVKGIAACERLMGLILTLISIQMIFKGITEFILSIKTIE